MKQGIYLAAFFLLPLLMPAYSQQWETDLQSALRKSASHDKPVMLFFTVSDQCENCRMLEQDIFSTDVFKSFSSNEVIPVKLDFSKMGADASVEVFERNLLIIEKYNKDGFFPLVVLLDTNGKVKGKSGIYEKEDARTYIGKLKDMIH